MVNLRAAVVLLQQKSLESETTVFEITVRTLCSFRAERTSVYRTAFDTVENHFSIPVLKSLFIPPVIIEPKPEDEHHPDRNVEKQQKIEF